MYAVRPIAALQSCGNEIHQTEYTMKRIFFIMLLAAVLLGLSGYAAFNSPPKEIRLRVGSYNIQAARLADGDITQLAEDIVLLELDVVGIQEIDVGTKRSDGKNLAQQLATACGLEYFYFAPAMAYDGGEYGIAIISRYPIAESGFENLSHSRNSENRVIAHARIDVDGFMFDFFNTHLSYESHTIRSAQLREVRLGMLSGSASILTGDFNIRSSDELTVLEGYRCVNNGTMVTFPEKGASYDDILTAPCWTVVRCGVQDVHGKSDHNLLWAELQYTE